jgi:hypothetical protein
MRAGETAIDFVLILVSFRYFLRGSCGGVLPKAGWDGWLGKLGWPLDAGCRTGWPAGLAKLARLAGFAGLAGLASWQT